MQYFRDPYLIQKKDKLNLLQSPEKRLGLYFWQLGQVQCGHKSCVCAIAQQENRKNRWGLKCCCSRNQAAVLLLRVLKGFFGQAVAACILYKRARKQGHKKAIPCRTKQGHLSSIVLEPYFPLDIEPLDYHQYYQMPPL